MLSRYQTPNGSWTADPQFVRSNAVSGLVRLGDEAMLVTQLRAATGMANFTEAPAGMINAGDPSQSFIDAFNKNFPREFWEETGLQPDAGEGLAYPGWVGGLRLGSGSPERLHVGVTDGPALTQEQRESLLAVSHGLRKEHEETALCPVDAGKVAAATGDLKTWALAVMANRLEPDKTDLLDISRVVGERELQQIIKEAFPREEDGYLVGNLSTPGMDRLFEAAGEFTKIAYVRATRVTTAHLHQTYVPKKGPDGREISSLETEKQENVGDWIVTEPNGTTYVCEDKNMKERYEETETPGVYRAKGNSKQFRNPTGKPVRIIKSWGVMNGDENCIFNAQLDPSAGDVTSSRYLIAADIASRTYRPFVDVHGYALGEPGLPAITYLQPTSWSRISSAFSRWFRRNLLLTA